MKTLISWINSLGHKHIHVAQTVSVEHRSERTAELSTLGVCRQLRRSQKSLGTVAALLQ